MRNGCSATVHGVLVQLWFSVSAISFLQVVLRAAAEEVDALVQKMGMKVHVSVSIENTLGDLYTCMYVPFPLFLFSCCEQSFPSSLGHETDVRKWIADMLVSIRWR